MKKRVSGGDINLVYSDYNIEYNDWLYYKS